MKKLFLLIVGASYLAFGIQAQAQVLLGTTGRGQLLEVDILNGTVTVVGDAGMLEGKPFETGWTGLSFDGTGNLFAVSRSGAEPSTGCPGSPLNPSTNCSFLYRVDPSTGAVMSEVGNIEMANVSDIDFDVGGVLFGSLWNGQGALVTVNPITGVGGPPSGAGGMVVPFGNKPGGVGLQNGGLSVHPGTGELWAIESEFSIDEGETPAIFKVDRNTGLIIGDPIAIGLSGSPVTFGFDSLEILPDGRFIASRARGRSEIYEINPVADAASGLAEITAIPLTLDATLDGNINGLEYFRPSPGPIELLKNDVIALGMDRRTTRRMTRILDKIQRKIDEGKDSRARTNVGVFITEIELAVDSGILAPVDADDLLKKISAILGDITFQ